MFGLIPREEQFFKLFQQLTQTVIEGSLLLKKMLEEYDQKEQIQKQIKETEHKADHFTHDIIEKLNKSFITPFDREDIYALATKIDDIMDLIDASAVRFIMYNVSTPTPEAKELAYLIIKGAQAVDKAVALLNGNHALIRQYLIDAHDFENESDRVSRDALSRLFHEEKDPIHIIKWKEIYEMLERATDKVEATANVIESIMVKNA